MPANVESMFSVRQMPWHREGTILDDYPGDWDAARTLAGLDWDPVTTGVYAFTGVDPDGTACYEPIDGWKAITRSDTGAILSVNKETYTVIDHAEMGEIVEAVLAQPGVKWETAGVLDSGRAVWCLALLDEPITLPGDNSPTLPYLAITNRHDGTAACALRATAVRIVCANTFRAAELEGERTGTTFSFIHKGRWRDRIDEARRAVTGAQAEMRRYADLARELLAIPITPVQRERFITEFIPKPPDGLITDRVARNVDEARTRAAAAVRLGHQRADRSHRLRPGPGRWRIPRPCPHRAVLGNPAQPDPDPARAAQAPGPRTGPRRHHDLTTQCRAWGTVIPRPGQPDQSPTSRKNRRPRHVPRYQHPARWRSPRLDTCPDRPARTLRAVRHPGAVPVPGQGRALSQGLRRGMDQRPRR